MQTSKTIKFVQQLKTLQQLSKQYLLPQHKQEIMVLDEASQDFLKQKNSKFDELQDHLSSMRENYFPSVYQFYDPQVEQQNQNELSILFNKSYKDQDQEIEQQGESGQKKGLESEKIDENDDEKKKDDGEEDEEKNNDEDDDDDDMQGGMLMPVIEFVKGFIPRLVQNPNTSSSMNQW